jgi:hypothetical protein
MVPRLLRAAALLSVITAASGCGSTTERFGPLGARGIFGYHILAGGSSLIPVGNLGYLATANGHGGFRIVWTDTRGSDAEFSGSIATDGVFDPGSIVSFNPNGTARITTNGPSEIDFDSIPGANLDGVDLVTSADPIYLTATIGNSTTAVSIFFTGADTHDLNVSAFDPVSFTSP